MAAKDIEKHKFKKGQSGNPNGRPKGSLNKSTLFNRWLELEEDVKNPITGEIERMSQAEIIIMRLIKEAREGSIQHTKELFDRYLGKSKESIDHTTNGENLNTGVIIKFRDKKKKDNE